MYLSYFSTYADALTLSGAENSPYNLWLLYIAVLMSEFGNQMERGPKREENKQ